MLNKIYLLLFAIFALFRFSSAESLKLDWDAALEMALEKSEDIAAAQDEIERADLQVGEAYSNAMPTVNASGVFQHYFKIPESIMILPPAFTGAPEEIRIRIKQGAENTAIGTVELNQPVWLAGKVGIAIKLAKLYKKISRHGLRVTKEELRQSLVGAFYGALLADEFLSVSREALAQAERHYEQVQNLHEQGMVSEYDLIRARVGVANVRPQVAEAEASQEIAYKGLKLMIGVDVDQDVELVGSLDQAVTDPLDYDKSVDVAMQLRSEFNQLGLQAELYEGNYIVEKRSSLWPNVFVNFNYRTMVSEEDFKFTKYEFLDGFSGTLSISMPLFDGFASHNRAQTALVNKRAALRQRAYLEKGVKVQIAEALSNFKKAEEQLEAARQTLAEAEKGDRIAEVRYREGVGTQIERLDAQLQLNSSKVNVLKAKYDLLNARAAYDRALGQGMKMEDIGE